MKFYQYFIVLIFQLSLVLNVFDAQADAIKLSAVYKGKPCTSTQKSSSSAIAPGAPVTDDNTLKCVIAIPYNETFTVECQPDRKLSSNLTLTWFKGTEAVQQNERVKSYSLLRKVDKKDDQNEEIESLVLQFNPIIPHDMDMYHCKVVKRDENPVAISPERTLSIEIKVLPYVKTAHKDFTVVEETSININCTVWSKVPTTVIWVVKTLGTSNEPKNYTSSEGRIILSKINDTTNAMLHIEHANLTLDRGTYHCLASSDVGFSTTRATFMIRLKSKYAALWPLIGICAEVIVLCGIIIIYEKKRDKTEMEESDTDQGPEVKNSPDHGQDGVRYRK